MCSFLMHNHFPGDYPKEVTGSGAIFHAVAGEDSERTSAGNREDSGGGSCARSEPAGREDVDRGSTKEGAMASRTVGSCFQDTDYGLQGSLPKRIDLVR